MDTLVLSASYEPVARVSWMRAVTLLWTGAAEVLEEYPDRLVRSVSLVMRMPSVIRTLRARRPRRAGVKLSRVNVYARDKGRCQYCSAALSREQVTYDHVLPRVQGGRTTWENVVICCAPCNQRKGGRTPAQAGMRLLSKPVRPRQVSHMLRFGALSSREVPKSWRAWLGVELPAPRGLADAA